MEKKKLFFSRVALLVLHLDWISPPPLPFPAQPRVERHNERSQMLNVVFFSLLFCFVGFPGRKRCGGILRPDGRVMKNANGVFFLLVFFLPPRLLNFVVVISLFVLLLLFFVGWLVG